MSRLLSNVSRINNRKEFKIGKTKFNRYSQKAIEKIKQELPSVNMAQIWNKYGDFLKKIQLFKPSIDDRYDINKVSTHENNEIKIKVEKIL